MIRNCQTLYYQQMKIISENQIKINHNYLYQLIVDSQMFSDYCLLQKIQYKLGFIFSIHPSVFIPFVFYVFLFISLIYHYHLIILLMQTTARSLVQEIERSTTTSPTKAPSTNRIYRGSLRNNKVPKISLEKQQAEIRYKKLTSLTKSEMMDHVRDNVRSRNSKNPEWKYDHYRVNNTFSVIQKHRGVEEFPHNNKKYNTQFLQKTLKGGGMNFTVRDTGFFPKAKDKLYSEHYKPIVSQKRKYNEDYELRPSCFGKIDLDFKKDRIMDQYILQANPFSTERSNQLICTMRSARKHRFS